MALQHCRVWDAESAESQVLPVRHCLSPSQQVRKHREVRGVVCPLPARELLGPGPTSGPPTHPPIELRGRLPPSRVLRGRAWLLDVARCLLVKWV